MYQDEVLMMYCQFMAGGNRQELRNFYNIKDERIFYEMLRHGKNIFFSI